MTSKGFSFLLTVVLFLGNKTTVVSGASEIPARSIPSGLNAAFCRGDFSFQTLWSFGLYDAQVEGLTLKARDGQPVRESAAVNRARELAKETKKPGYAGGACTDGSAWSAVFQSPYAIELKNSRLDLSEYAPFCHAKLGVYFSDADQGLSKELLGKKNIYECPKRDGFVVVVCDDKERGPQEVFLGPTSPKWVVPGLHELTKRSDVDKTLVWINSVRVQNQRKPLVIQEDFMHTAKTLSETGGVAHDLKRLDREAKRLRNKHLELIGENRVKARTLEEALTLLWLSPLHRDLLLSDKASGIGLSILAGHDLFLQITVGRSTK